MRVPVALLVLSGCGISEDTFRERYAEDLCAVAVECLEEEGASVAFFDSEPECRALVTLAWGLLPDACEYDPSAARACLAATRSLSCDAYDDAAIEPCYDVYQGDGCAILGGDDASWATTP